MFMHVVAPANVCVNPMCPCLAFISCMHLDYPLSGELNDLYKKICELELAETRLGNILS